MIKFDCILLVDDDGIANFTNYRLIKKIGLSNRIETVVNGEKALNFIQHFAETNLNRCPEFILLDLKMPVLDGIQFLEYFFRKSFSNTNPILISILSEIPLQSKDFLKKYPGLKYIEKPLTEEKLKTLLNADQQAKGQN